MTCLSQKKFKVILSVEILSELSQKSIIFILIIRIVSDMSIYFFLTEFLQRKCLENTLSIQKMKKCDLVINQNQKEKKMLQNFNLFPQSRYFRVNRNAELDHRCGGFASIVIIGLILVILLVKLVEMFSMKTIFYMSQTIAQIEPPMTTISTYQNDTLNSPFMMATSFQSGGCPSTKNVKAYHYTVEGLQSGGRPNITTSQIVLETCTVEHFAIMPTLYEKMLVLGIKPNTLCLPLNKNYEIGGSFELSNTWKGILFRFNCTQSCGVNNCGSILVNNLNSVSNPDSQNPFLYYLDKDVLQFSDRVWNQYVYELNENKITTDSSLLPFSNLATQTSLTSQRFKQRKSIFYTTPTTTDLWVERSSITTVTNRRYLKIIDTLSYVGGIFPTLFTVFLFGKIFGLYFFEMGFANHQWKCQQTTQKSFVHFIKLTMLNLLTKLGFEMRSWKIAKKQKKVNQTVNKLLDINYLFRRIQFLERAISLLLSKPQLKGIYLARNNMKSVGDSYKRLSIRDHLVKYLDKKEKQRKEKETRQREKGAPLEKQKIIILEKNQEQKTPKTKKEIDLDGDPKEKKKEDVRNSPKSESARSMSKTKSIQQDQIPGSQIKKGLSEEELQRMQNQKRISIESSMISDLDDPDEQWISDEFQGDLKQLFKEANGKGDPISKKVVQNIEEWLRKQLQFSLQEYERDNPRFQFRLYSQTDFK